MIVKAFFRRALEQEEKRNAKIRRFLSMTSSRYLSPSRIKNIFPLQM
jgi:hypothetical protein